MKISCESCYIQYCSQNDINFEGSNISCLSLLTRRWYSNGIRPVAQLWRFMIQFSPDAFALLHNTKFLQHFFFLFDINHESLKKYQRKNSFQQKFLFELLFTLLKQKRTNYQSRFDSMHSSLSTCLNYRFTIILVNPCGVQKRTSSVIIRSWWTRHYSLTPLFSLVRTSCSRPSTLLLPPPWIKHGCSNANEKRSLSEWRGEGDWFNVSRCRRSCRITTFLKLHRVIA